MTEVCVKPRLRLRIGLLFLAILLAFGLSEFCARFIWKHLYNNWLEKQLHGIDWVDRERSIILPKANTTVTVNQLRESLRTSGKTIGVAHLDNIVREIGLSDGDTILTINSHGFRGPDFDIPKPRGVFRILALGDSCTWGPAVDYYTYPQIIQRHLGPWMSAHCSKTLEVVNGGVPGYNLERLIKRLDEYRAVDPDLVTVYIGWNRTIGRADPKNNLALYRRLAIYRFFYHSLINRNTGDLAVDFGDSTYYDPNDPGISSFSNYDFSLDMGDLEKITALFSSRGIPVVICTLAGILDWRISPDQRTLEAVYPISSTNNVYAYPVLTRQFNSELRAYAVSRGLPVIDFEEFAFNHFRPRREFFVDSVHPSLKGYQLMGEFFSERLRNIVDCQTSHVQNRGGTQGSSIDYSVRTH